jgi:hypothetical protein
VIPELLDYLGSVGKVVVEGTVDEKRRFLRTFIRRVELDPTTGTGRAEVYDLPVLSPGVQEKKDSLDGRPSSFQVVAGVGFDTDSPSWEWEEVELERLAAAMA